MPETRIQLPRVLGLPQLHEGSNSAPLVARLAVGAVFLGHGLPRFSDPNGFNQFLDMLGIQVPVVLGWILMIGEPLAAFALILGLFSRIVSAALIVQMGLAITVVARDTGFMTPHDGSPSYGAGFELHQVMIAGLFLVLSTGPGALALDRVVGLEPRLGPRPAMTPMKIAGIYGLILGLLGAALAAALNHIVIGVPGSAGANGTDHAISGALAGLVAGVAALLIYQRRSGIAPALAPAIVSGLIGGVVGAVMSGLVNYALIGMPADAAANTTNHAVSGMLSGYMSAFIGLMLYLRKAAPAAEGVGRPAAASLSLGESPAP